MNWKFGEKNTWTKLEIINSSEKEVEFKAYFTDKFGKENIHHGYLLLKIDKNGIMFRGNFGLKLNSRRFCGFC